MPDRRALIIGHWGPEGSPGPTRQRVKGFTGRLERILAPDGRYPFHAISARHGPPQTLLNPGKADVIRLLADEADGIDRESVLLVYYIGHSRPNGEHDLDLTLRYDKTSDRYSIITLSTLLREISDAGFRQLILVLDSCHSGRSAQTIAQFPNYFAMFAAGSNYAFNANFTDRILTVLEAPPRGRDQRISRRHGGFTYNKLFEIARGSLLELATPGYRQEPVCAGGMGDVLLAEAPPQVADGYNHFASRRTIYGRIYTTTLTVRETRGTAPEIIQRLEQHPAFLLNQDEATGERRPLSRDRILTYLDFLRRIDFAHIEAGHWLLTPTGEEALDEARYNALLIRGIDEHLLGEEVTLADIDWAAQELLIDQIPPTAKNIRDRLLQKRKSLPLDETIKLGLTALPTTGRFMKSSADALFPSERALGV